MTDLTDRLRTCAAHLNAISERYAPDEDEIPIDQPPLRDAVSLLREAADTIDKITPPEPLGEPMAILEPVTPPPPTTLGPVFRDPGVPNPYAAYEHARACPKCGARVAMIVHIKKQMLECPACEHHLPLQAVVGPAKWV